MNESADSGEVENDCDRSFGAILVSLFSGADDDDARISLEELSRLVDTAGGRALGVVTQTRDKPDARTYIGKGKLEELATLLDSTGADVAVFDTELSPAQIKCIEDALEERATVIDRSMLILDIFAARATSAEGRLQVELAQLKYTAPRLMGKGRDMSRLGGGVGTRGPGESKLEIDRRRLKTKVRRLEDEIERIGEIRKTQRASRVRGGIACCAVVGYTNAGKSTLLNTLTDADILSEDKLFATLDPTTRQYVLPSGRKILLTDTVGFIRNLPHHLISAFRSTLDEAVYADLLIIVCDASDENLATELEVTRSTLCDLGASGKPTLIVFNKCDAIEDKNALLSMKALADGADETSVFISALTGEGIDEFSEKLEKMLSCGKRRVELEIPLSESGIVATVYKICEDVEVEYTDDGVKASALVDEKSAGRLKKYIVDYDAIFINEEL
ncbi:MAG: GTPase HflX [Clostridia bacterium]|nr:GTPase HflX [Clostridia bacterium]